MDLVSVFAIISAIIGIGFLSELIFRKTNIPDVLLLIGVGVTIGPVLGWVDANQLGWSTTLFTGFALLFILFQGALSINFRELIDSLSQILKLTLVSFILSFIVVAGIAYLILHDIGISILLGAILSGTSSAIVIPLVRNLKSATNQSTVLTIESAINDVLCIVAAITVIKILQTGNAYAPTVFKTLLASFSLAIVVGIFVGLFWILLLERYTILREAYMVSIGVVIGLYALVESPFVEANGAIAALAFGLMMGNSKNVLHAVMSHKKPDTSVPSQSNEEHPAHAIQDVLSEGAKSFFSEISFFVKVFFFVYLGLLIDITNWLPFVYGAIIAFAVHLIRPAAVRFAFDAKLPDKERTMLEVLAPKGLAAAVLAQLAVQNAIPGSETVVSVVIPTVVASILFTGAFAFLTERGWFVGLWGSPKRHRQATPKE